MNMRRLPETVEVTKMAINTKSEEALFGFLELSTTTISRGLAVNFPVILTAICLVMMLCSKRAMYPFVIAVFTLLLPIALYFFAVFPA
jgi:cytochrome bd-type quinol oxidase subunit 2